MKQFLKILTSVLTVIIILMALIWVIPGSHAHVLAILTNKREILSNRSSPRVVFFGGSNLVILRSGLIEEELRKNKLNHNVVNMSLWAGLHSGNVINYCKKALNKGDCVVLCQEYSAYLDNEFIETIKESEEAKMFLFLMSPEEYYLNEKGLVPILSSLKYIVLLNQIKIKSYSELSIRGKWGNLFKAGYMDRDFYSPVYGDSLRPFASARPLNGSGHVFEPLKMKNLMFIKELQEYFKIRGIIFIVSFPPFPKLDYLLNKNKIDELYKTLKQDLKINVLNNPEEMIFDNNDFADSVNHLNIDSEVRRSRRLSNKIVDLLKKL
jgi:hypothetical protein